LLSLFISPLANGEAQLFSAAGILGELLLFKLYPQLSSVSSGGSERAVNENFCCLGRQEHWTEDVSERLKVGLQSIFLRERIITPITSIFERME